MVDADCILEKNIEIRKCQVAPINAYIGGSLKKYAINGVQQCKFESCPRLLKLKMEGYMLPSSAKPVNTNITSTYLNVNCCNTAFGSSMPYNI